MSFINSSLWVEQKYVGLLSYRLEKFKVKSNHPYLANMRCPLCGDSEKNKNKTRGYIFEKDGSLLYKCHNCFEAFGIGKLIEYVDQNLFQQFRIECYKESGQQKEAEDWKPDISKFAQKRFTQFGPLKQLKKISQLPHDHGAVKYVRDTRKIPPKQHHKLFYVSKFAHWVNSFIPGKFDTPSLAKDEPRLIIPFIDKSGYVFGFQGRSFKKTTDLRYITIMLDDAKPKIFGLDSVDISQEVYILEGPIDSMFIPNSLAFAGADGNIDAYVPKDKAILIYDNEPRNQEIVKKIHTNILKGYSVFIWPDIIKAKDINDLYLTGMPIDEIMWYIHTNTSTGLSALTRLNEWKKVTI